MEVNWENIWEKNYERYTETMRSGSNDREYWSKRAADFSNARSSNDFEYGRMVLGALWSRMLTPQSVVLDVGAGPGTFIIPFSRKVRRIDAIEPAPGMVDKIRENANRAGITNFCILNSTWQDVDLESISGRYDLVISSLVLWIFRDVWHQLLRMEEASRGYCCIVANVANSNKHVEILWKRVTGCDDKWPSISEYPLIFSILHSKGRKPNVSIIEYTYERSVEDKVMHIKSLFERRIPVTQEMENTIREYFIELSENGKVKEPGMSAVICWRAHESCIF